MRQCPVCQLELPPELPTLCPRCGWDLANDLQLVVSVGEVPDFVLNSYRERFARATQAWRERLELQAEIARLQAEKAAVEAAQEESRRRRAEEEAFWGQCAARGDIDAYREYLRRYAHGFMAEAARQAIKLLEQKARAEQEAARVAAELKMQAAAVAEQQRQREAAARAEEQRRSEAAAAKKREKQRTEEEAFWKHCAARGTVKAYREYLSKYPRGFRLQTAEQAIKSLVANARAERSASEQAEEQRRSEAAARAEDERKKQAAVKAEEQRRKEAAAKVEEERRRQAAAGDDEARRRQAASLPRGGIWRAVKSMFSGREIWLEPLTGMELVWIPGGSFEMGAPEYEEGHSSKEGPPHEVCVDGFWLSKYPVTQKQWQKVMGSNPSSFKNGDNYPVEKVSWHDAHGFIKKLDAMNGGQFSFRLPTEAEWEYACRAGTRTPFYFGKTVNTKQANYDGNYVYGNGQKGLYRQKTTPVWSFPANAFGLYDMHGNVWEWCEDIYSDQAYSKHQSRNPIYTGTDYKTGSHRVLRGGSWDSYPHFLRSAYRSNSDAARRSHYVGFRLAKTR